jgi:hypothetical protein
LLKHPQTRIVISVLKAVRHSVLGIWNALDVKVTESAREAKNHVGFLSRIEWHIELIDRLDPSTCKGVVIALITMAYGIK